MIFNFYWVNSAIIIGIYLKNMHICNIQNDHKYKLQ